jgi:hypothetical protein
MKGLKDKLNETNLGNPNSLTKNDNMEGLINKLDDTYLDGSPKYYGGFIKKYDDSNQYIASSEGAIRGQGNLLQLFEKTKADGLLDPPPSSYTTKIGSEVKSLNTPTPYNSKNTYSDQFRTQGDETLLKRTIDEYI